MFGYLLGLWTGISICEVLRHLERKNFELEKKNIELKKEIEISLRRDR